MQPYIFPYIGYFQLIQSSDHFVFYDDVNFIKKGWINRNYLLVNGKRNLFTVPLIKPSQNKLIKDIEISKNQNWAEKLLLTIQSSYKKAPYFEETYTLIENIISKEFNSIGSLASESVLRICEFLSIKKKYSFSSKISSKSKELDKANRLITICKENNSETYINAIGGKDLYTKEFFLKQNINLQFLDSNIIEYSQKPYSSEFEPHLSIIDILMFNSKNEVKKMLDLYNLI